MILSISKYSIVGYSEGQKEIAQEQRYERNPINRKLCLLHKGYKCCVCGFDFEKEFGEIGKSFIEVHHSLPVSQMGENHVVDPLKELYPLCSNCHTMIHKKSPPFIPVKTGRQAIKTNIQLAQSYISPPPFIRNSQYIDCNKSSREAQIVGEKTTGETFRTSANFAVVSALGVRAFFSY